MPLINFLWKWYFNFLLPHQTLKKKNRIPHWDEMELRKVWIQNVHNECGIKMKVKIHGIQKYTFFIPWQKPDTYMNYTECMESICNKSIQNEHWIPHSFWMVYADVYVYKTWMEGTYDIPNKKSIFLHDYRTKSNGVFAEMQIISYIFIILKHIQVRSQFRKLLMLKVRL